MKLKRITQLSLMAALLFCGVSCQKQKESEVGDTVVIRTDECRFCT